MQSRTIFLSRLLGLYTILSGLAMVLHKHTSIIMVNELVRNAPMLFMLGVITVGVGLAMVLGHNIWSGGALPVVVTIVGWITLLKGLLFLFLLPDGMVDFLAAMHWEQGFNVYVTISLLLGAYLTYAGLAVHRDFEHPSLKHALR